MYSPLPHISVCICTYRRPHMLSHLLEHLENQICDALFSYSIIVVDNDYLRSAENIVSSFKEMSFIRIEYYCEPIQNISLARNKALKYAKGNYIAFIDDDEFPARNWLFSLLKACYELKADGIQGRVIPLFADQAPQWVVKGRFYEKPNYTTGIVLKWRQGVTANLLVRRTMIENNCIMFNPEFGGGGEDQDFFRRAIEKGYVFKYCHEAIAYEYIPPIRWKRTFLLKRALLRGKIAVLHPTFDAFSIFISLAAVLLYTASLPLLFLLEHYIFMQLLIRDCDHIGKILAFCNINIGEDTYITE